MMSQEHDSTPVVTFCRRRDIMPVIETSVADNAEVQAKGYIPKPSYPRVILVENAIEQRKLNMKLDDINKKKKETGHYYENLKISFLNDQQKKYERWERDHRNFVSSLIKVKKVESIRKIAKPGMLKNM